MKNPYNKINKDMVISDTIKITNYVLLDLYDLLLKKLSDTIYKIRLSRQFITLKNRRNNFERLSLLEKCIVLEEILHIFQCNIVNADITMINEGKGKDAGKLQLIYRLSNYDKVEIINQSITGFYEQVIDLKTI